MKTIRIELTVERYQKITLGPVDGATRAWCFDCREKALMVTTNQAAKLKGVSSRQIYLQVEEGLLHFKESADGVLRICVRSLLGSAYPSA